MEQSDSYYSKHVLVAQLKLQLHDAIYRLRFYSKSLIHILSLPNSHNNVASIQKNRSDKSHRVIVALINRFVVRVNFMHQSIPSANTPWAIPWVLQRIPTRPAEICTNLNSLGGGHLQKRV